MKKYKLISVDVQNDFASEGGACYETRPSVEFMNQTLFPYLQEHGIRIAEIISDYRQPRQGDTSDCCRPGEWGYESILPRDIVGTTWIKSMNSPVWIRDGAGDPNQKPSQPYQDPKRFDQWLAENVGSPDEVIPVIFGLTVDCCVLATAQELSWRGYYPLVLAEGTDHYSGKVEDKSKILESPMPNWAQPINWAELAQKLTEA